MTRLKPLRRKTPESPTASSAKKVCSRSGTTSPIRLERPVTRGTGCQIRAVFQFLSPFENLGAGDRANVRIVAEGARNSNYGNPEIFRDVLHPNHGQYPSSSEGLGAMGGRFRVDRWAADPRRRRAAQWVCTAACGAKDIESRWQNGHRVCLATTQAIPVGLESRAWPRRREQFPAVHRRR